MRPSTKSPTRTSRDRKRSKSPQTVEKKFSRYLYHPPSYFTQKGQKARQNSHQYQFEHPNKNSLKLLVPKQGVLSKASRDPSALERTQIEAQMLRQQFEDGIDGPWYPGGTKMDTHKSRVKFNNKRSKSKLEEFKLSGSIERQKNSSNYALAKNKSPHLNTIKAKNRRLREGI